MATGILKNWCIWITPTDRQWRAEYEVLRPREWAAVMTGEVVEDTLLRWPPGSAMRSSALVGFDLQAMKCVTQNSVYQLRGPGRIKTGVPHDYSEAVGATIAELSHIPRNPWLVRH